MIKRLFKLWVNMGYTAFMVGAKKGEKSHRWREGLRYMFNTYYFFFSIAIFGNIIIAIFPTGLNLTWFLVFFGIIAVYIYYYSKTFDKLIDNLNYDPSVAYKKNTLKEIIAIILFIFSKLIIIPLLVFSFYIFNYFKYIIGGMFN